MLRDLNLSANGRRDSTDPRSGVLASEIPTGGELPAFLLNDIDAAFPNRLYKMRLKTIAAAVTIFLEKNSSGTASAPNGVYTGTMQVEKFDPGVGRVYDAEGPYSLTFGATGQQPASTVTGVTVTPSTASGSQTFTANVAGTNSPSQAVTWSKTGGGTITAGGVFTAPAATGAVQTIAITATSVQDPTKSGTATVTIAAAAPPQSTVTGVTVSPSTATVAAGATQQFTALVAGANNPSQAVAWSAALGQITAGGLFTAPAATSQDQHIVVTATSALDGTKKGTATVTVPAVQLPSTVIGVTVNPPVAIGSVVFSAEVAGENSPSQAVTWAASGGQINSAGAFVAPDQTSVEQVVTVTATSVQDPTKSGTATVTIAAAPSTPAAPPVVYEVKITPDRPYVAGGASKEFAALIEGANNPIPDVTWRTTFGTINALGQLSVPPTSEPRKAIVTATSVQDPTQSASTSVTVTPPVLYGVAGPRSKARTLVVTDPQVVPDTSDGTGTFFDFANPSKPKGIKDPDSVIDVSWDLRQWFGDSGDGYQRHEILVEDGVVLMATNEEDMVISAFLASGDLGYTAAITCRWFTDSTPPRSDDRTIYLKIRPR